MHEGSFIWFLLLSGINTDYKKCTKNSGYILIKITIDILLFSIDNNICKYRKNVEIKNINQKERPMKEQYKPIVGITIGDPAGIGPEIILKALGEKHIYDECRPLVIGCVNVLERAKAILPQCSLEFNRIESVSDACFRFGTIDVLETGHYDISKLV